MVGGEYRMVTHAVQRQPRLERICEPPFQIFFYVWWKFFSKIFNHGSKVMRFFRVYRSTANLRTSLLRRCAFFCMYTSPRRRKDKNMYRSHTNSTFSFCTTCPVVCLILDTVSTTRCREQGTTVETLYKKKSGFCVRSIHIFIFSSSR